MEKYILECKTCGSTSSTKKEEELKNYKCYYCESEMEVIYHADSSAPTLWGFTCDKPKKNFIMLKPEFRDEYMAKYGRRLENEMYNIISCTKNATGSYTPKQLEVMIMTALRKANGEMAE